MSASLRILLVLPGLSGVGTTAAAQVIGPPPQVVPEWKAPQVYDTGGTLPYGLAVADLVGAGGANPDGYPDVAVSNAATDLNTAIQLWAGEPGTVRIFRNSANWDPPSATSLTQFQDLTVCDRCAPNEIAFANIFPEDSRPALVVAVSGITVEDRDPWPNCTTLWARWVEVDEAGLYVFRWMAEPFNRYSDTPAFYPALDGGEQYPLRSLTVADFNGDGLDDVAAGTDFLWAEGTYPYDQGVPPFDKVFVWLNDGQGSLVLQAPALDSRMGYTPAAGAIVAGNFDATASSPRPDLVASTEGDPDPAALTLFTNQGAYPYPSSVQTGGGWAFWQMATGQFNTATKHKGIAGSYFAADGIRILHGDGAGGLTSHPTNDLYLVRNDCIPRAGKARGVYSGLINGGTTVDLAATLPDDDRVGLLLGKGDGTFQYECGNPNYHPLVDPADDLNVEFRPIQVLIADLNQDGFGDLITANHGWGNLPPQSCTREPVRLITVRINKMVVVNPAP